MVKERTFLGNIIEDIRQLWERLVIVLSDFLGLSEKTIRKGLLVAFVPFCTIVGRLFGILSLYLKYHIFMCVPVEYLRLEESYVISSLVGLALLLGVTTASLVMYRLCQKSTYGAMLCFVLYAFLQRFDFGFGTHLGISVIIWGPYVAWGLPLVWQQEDEAEKYTWADARTGILLNILCAVGITVLCRILVGSRFPTMKVALAMAVVYGLLSVEEILKAMSKPKAAHRVNQTLVVVLVIGLLCWAYALFHNGMIGVKAETHRILPAEQKVIVYNTEDYEILSPCYTDEEGDFVIDLTRQEITKLTETSYEIREIDEVYYIFPVGSFNYRYGKMDSAVEGFIRKHVPFIWS